MIKVIIKDQETWMSFASKRKILSCNRENESYHTDCILDIWSWHYWHAWVSVTFSRTIATKTNLLAALCKYLIENSDRHRGFGIMVSARGWSIAVYLFFLLLFLIPRWTMSEWNWLFNGEKTENKRSLHFRQNAAFKVNVHSFKPHCVYFNSLN